MRGLAGLHKLRGTKARIAVGAAILLLWLGIGQSGAWRSLETGLLDALIVSGAPKRVSLPITLVGIDDATFAELELQGALPRRLHAQVLDRLNEAQAAVVAFDLVMPRLVRSDDDAVFADSIRRFGRVVLAADMMFSESASVRQWTRVDPSPALVEAGAVAGFAGLAADGDGILRRFPEPFDAFAFQIVRAFDKHRPATAEYREPRREFRIRYIGGPRSFTYLPFQSLLDPDKRISPQWKDLLRDNIVIVGRNFHTSSEFGGVSSDAMRTPFFEADGEFMPRIEAHANIVASMILGSALVEASRFWGIVATLVTGGLAIALMLVLRIRAAALAVVGLAGLLLGIELLAHFGFNARIALLNAAAAPLAVFLALGALTLVSDRQLRSQVRAAFGGRVSDAVANRLVEHPEAVGHHCDRRPLSVLACSLGGLDEAQLPAEAVAGIAARHRAAVAAAVIEQEGTVQGREGGRVVAFWGAPAADERQALHAALAASMLHDSLRELCAAIAREHGVRLVPRIGVSRGDCVVGDLGGDAGFDYAAIGEPVEAARRLERAAQAYGTTVLLDQAVAEAVQKRVALRELDRVRIDGSERSFGIYDVCNNPQLVEMSAKALAAYRNADFASAAAQWRQIAERHPDDGVARVFARRCERLDGAGRPEGWDEVSVLGGVDQA